MFSRDSFVDNAKWLNFANSDLFLRFLALLSGATFSVSFAPFKLWPLGILCIVLFFHTLHLANRSSEKFLRGLFFGLGKFLISASWILDSLISHTGTSPVTSAGLYFLLAILVSLLFGLACIFSLRLKSKLVSASLFSSAVAVYEILMSFPIGFSFPLLHIGYAYVDTPVAALATLGGVWLVSYAVVFSSVAIYFAFRKFYVPLVVTLACWIFCIPLQGFNWTTEGDSVTVGLVQANITSETETSPAQIREAWNKHERMTQRVAKSELIIWPEAAIPTLLQTLDSDLAELSQVLSGTLVIGSFEQEGFGPRRNTFNVAALASVDEIYRKQQLVPFGEYTPNIWLLDSLFESINFPTSNLTPGNPSTSLLKTNNMVLKTAICYEVAYPQLINRSIVKADLVVALNADGWFGRTIGPAQQLQIAQMRARETGKYVLRVSNVGPTAVIRPNGSIQKSIPSHDDHVLQDDVHSRRGSTPFSQFGLIPIGGLLLISFVFSIVCVFRESRT